MQDRVLIFEGVHNFRDYGGYAVAGGARLKTGLLYRSGQHLDATADDLNRVFALNLTTVVDLRGNSERADFPCARHPDFAAKIIFADGETAGAGNAHDENAHDVRTAADAHQAMITLYQAMPFRPLLIEVFKSYFEYLSMGYGASLIHCFAGKDRTGLAVSMTLRVLGVHVDDVMADYLLTNTAGDIDRRIAAGAEGVRAGFGPIMDDAAVRTLMSVHPEYLDTAIAAIVAQHDSISAYAADVLGITPAKRDAIKTALIT